MKLKGCGISPGLASGTAVVLEEKQIVIPEDRAENAQEQIAAFYKAHETVLAQYNVFYENARQSHREKEADIFSAHLDILQDDDSLVQPIVSQIQEHHWNAAKAVDFQMQQIIAVFESVDDDYMKLRACDMRDVREQLLRCLLDIQEPDLSLLPPESVIVSNEITPSDIGKMELSHVAGFISWAGGLNSHSSIIARSMGIPAVSQVENPTSVIRAGMQIILNGSSGEIELEPDAAALSKYRKQQQELAQQQADSLAFKEKPTVTADGHVLQLWANIGTPQEADQALAAGAEGIGLFRSEFLYMDRDTLPDEEEQFTAYKRVVEQMAPRPVVIRTLDIGGDKELPALCLESESNPFLGFRAIRLCLDMPELFLVQLRALLRASAFGDLRIMFPLISTMDELHRAKQMVEQAKQELDARGVHYNQNLPVGMMVEVPSAAIRADAFAQEVDFFSIGTNDLTQYTLAADRGNGKVGHIYDVHDLAVLTLIRHTIKAAKRHRIPCGLCGEAGADGRLQPFLIGCGIDELSMSSGEILKTRMAISKLNFEQCEKIAETFADT